MARNLQAKLPSSDTVRVFDINAESTQKFAEETKALGSGAAVTIAASVREAAEDSVSFPDLFLSYGLLPRIPYMMSLFYP
jgi:3-hydroxyisobutyrate dehydrogenase